MPSLMSPSRVKLSNTYSLSDLKLFQITWSIHAYLNAHSFHVNNAICPQLWINDISIVSRHHFCSKRRIIFFYSFISSSCFTRRLAFLVHYYSTCIGTTVILSTEYLRCYSVRCFRYGHDPCRHILQCLPQIISKLAQPARYLFAESPSVIFRH